MKKNVAVMEVANEDVGFKVAEASKRVALEVTNQRQC